MNSDAMLVFEIMQQCRVKQDRQWAERSHVSAAPALIVFSVTPADTSLQY